MRAFRTAVGLCAAAMAMMVVPALAAADQVLCGVGAGAGQCDSPSGVAVDRSEGLVYVADQGNARVNVFEADGTFLTSFGSAGTGAGQFAGMTGIAVDNDPASPAFHAVYVFEAASSNRRVQRLTPSGEFVWMVGADVNKTKVGEGAPEAARNLCTAASGEECGAGGRGFGPGEFDTSRGIEVGPGGVLHVLDHRALGGGQFEKRVQRFAPTGEASAQILLTDTPAGQTQALAVDSAGRFYVANAGTAGAVRKYSPSGELLATFHESFNIRALALDGADNLFVSDNTPEFADGGKGAETAIYQYDSAIPPNPIRTFYGNGTLRQRPVALAPFSNATGDVFVAELAGSPDSGRVVQVAFPAPGPVIPDDPSLLKADPVGSVRATLNAAVNPEGESSEVRFDYVEKGICEEDVEALGPGHCFDRAEETPWSDPTEPKFKLVEASAEIFCDSEEPDGPTCLKPNTAYTFRALAKNVAGETVGPQAEFVTGPTLELGDTWSTDVGIETATVHAELDPRSLPTTAYFEYVEEATWEASGFDEAQRAPAGGGSIDFGSGEGEVSRSTAIFPLQPATTYRYRYIASNFFETFVGAEGVLRTFPSVASPRTDCPNQAFRTGPAALLPNCRAYEMVSPVDKNNGDIISPAGPVFSRPASYYQSAGEGDGLTYSSATAFADPRSAPFVSQLLATRGGSGWRSESISPPRSRNVDPGIPGGEALNNLFSDFSEDLSLAWLRHDADPPLGDPPGVEGFWNIYRGDNATGAYEALTTVQPPNAVPTGEGKAYRPVLQGVSADGETAVYRATDQLTAEAAPCTTAPPCRAQLYLQTGPGAPRVVSVLPSGTASGHETSVGSVSGGPWNDNLTNALSRDGSKVYWTEYAVVAFLPRDRLFLRLNPSEAQSAIVAGKCSEAEKACTVAVSEKVASDPSKAPPRVRFWAADPQGERAIFTVGDDLYRYDHGSESAEPIAQGVQGVPGAGEDLARIYLISDEALAAGGSAGEPNLYMHEDGEGLRFIATLAAVDVEPGGYTPGSELPSGRTARVTPDGGQLAFTSSGSLTGYDNAEAASGQAVREVYRYDAEAGRLDCVSCNPSGARPRGRELEPLLGGWTAAQIPPWQTSLSAQRVLSEDGSRLYFESFDALLPIDTNGKMDVYQWEAPGSGECDAGGGNHFAANGGCLSLISSGTSAGDSALVDISTEGEDVFFTTESSLVRRDPGLIDVYDARVGGGFPLPPPPPVPCEGDACQAPSSAPEQPSPSSSSYTGPGNAAASPRGRCRRAAGKAKRAGTAARRMRKAARRASGQGQKRLQRRAGNLANRARRQSRAAKRCRAGGGKRAGAKTKGGRR